MWLRHQFRPRLVPLPQHQSAPLEEPRAGDAGTAPMAVLADNTPAPQSAVSIDIRARLRGMWADL
jgi:hypothetical protein